MILPFFFSKCYASVFSWARKEHEKTGQLAHLCMGDSSKVVRISPVSLRCHRIHWPRKRLDPLLHCFGLLRNIFWTCHSSYAMLLCQDSFGTEGTILYLYNCMLGSLQGWMWKSHTSTNNWQYLIPRETQPIWSNGSYNYRQLKADGTESGHRLGIWAACSLWEFVTYLETMASRRTLHWVIPSAKDLGGGQGSHSTGLQWLLDSNLETLDDVWEPSKQTTLEYSCKFLRSPTGCHRIWCVFKVCSIIMYLTALKYPQCLLQQSPEPLTNCGSSVPDLTWWEGHQQLRLAGGSTWIWGTVFTIYSSFLHSVHDFYITFLISTGRRCMHLSISKTNNTVYINRE